MTLTREQVEWICSGSSAVKETLKQLADTDAALRQELADLQDQARQRRLTPDGYCSYCDAYAAGWLTECTNPIHTDGLPRLVELRQELEDVPTLRGDLEMLMTQLKERDSIIDQLRQRVADLTQQLALAQMELRERAKDCTEHCEDFTRAQLQLNTVKRKLATVTSALEVLCEAIERGELDEDYLRRWAAECRTALEKMRGV
jgi:chromosome segregation ATPase